jgi:hypothetical protein
LHEPGQQYDWPEGRKPMVSHDFNHQYGQTCCGSTHLQRGTGKAADDGTTYNTGD